MTLYYVYLDPLTKAYEIYQTREPALVGTYEMLPEGKVFYFACFSRLLDASRYVGIENKGLRERLSGTNRSWEAI